MANIPFTIYEAIVLLEAYLSVHTGELSRKTAIKSVSEKLRILAVSQGLTIDKSYRNEIGIDFQFRSLGISLGVPLNSRTSTKLFDEVFLMRNSNYEEYRKKLQEVNDMIENKQNHQNQFYYWLSNKASPFALSEYYDLFSLFHCHITKNNSPQVDLFEITDKTEIQLFVSNLPEGYISGVVNGSRVRKPVKKVEEAIGLYLKYLSENGYDNQVQENKEENTTSVNLQSVLLQNAGQVSNIEQHKDKTLKTVDFMYIKDLAFTKPVVASYFEEKISNIKSWTDLYVNLMKLIYEDYSDKIPVGKSFGEGNRCDLGNSLQKIYMVAPKQIAEDLYIETNLSAKNIIDKLKLILDICLIDYENINVKYVVKKKDFPTLEKNDFPATKEEDRLLEFLQKRKLFYIDNRDKNGALWVLGGKELSSVLTFCKVMFKAQFKFMEKGSKATKGVSAWWTKNNTTVVVELNKTATKAVASTEILKENKSETSKDQTHKAITKVLYLNFSNGIDVKSFIDMIRFKQFYQGNYGKEIDKTDEDIINIIKKESLCYDNKYFFILEETKERIKKTIEKILSNYSIVYFDSLYNDDFEWFSENKIYSSDMLRALVEYVVSNNFNKQIYIKIKKNYFTSSQKTRELDIIADEIDASWGRVVLRQVEYLTSLIKYVPEDRIKYTLSMNDRFKRSQKDIYANIKYFVYTEENIDKIRDYARRKCIQNGSVSFENIEMGTLFIDNYEMSPMAIYDFLYSKIKDEFERNDKVLSLYGQSNDIEKEIEKFCLENDEINIKEIEKIVEKSYGRSRIQKALEYANLYKLRISEDMFVSKGKITFDKMSIDCILDEMILDDFISIKEIVTYARFPQCEYVWNAFLLESFIRNYSDNYKYLSLSMNSKNIGVIVRKNNNDTYHELMVRAVSRSYISEEKEEVFDYLIQMGYLGKRTYNKIDELVKEFVQRRNNS